LIVETSEQAHLTADVSAQLVIHVNERGAAGGPHASALDRLRALWVRGAHPQKLETLRLKIDDLWGRRVYATEEDGPLIKIILPAGTYDITACRGRFRRRYTMILEQGARSDLHLQLMADPS
jgi:hypothetical protein